MAITPVILSGGAGTRLWPLSRALYPKQLLSLAGERSMLQDTVLRAADPARFNPPLIVANEEHRFIIAEQLRQIGVTADTILLEPEGRNTAPALALAALYLNRNGDDPLMLVMPSDHVIADPAAFQRAVTTATAAAEDGALVTFGITPNRAETGYGYIERGEPRPEAGVFCVRRFVEKPDVATAEEYVKATTFFWNAGIFLFKCSALLDELQVHAAAVWQAAQAAMTGCKADLSFHRPDAAAFKASPAISIDYAVMEKTHRALVTAVDMGWNDVGSWSALWDITPKDTTGNALHGDVIAIDSRNSLLRSDGPALAAVGVNDLVVVATEDAVLVAHKSQAQNVKKVVDELARRNRQEHISHVTVHRPWGSYQTADAGDRYQVKRIVVKPGHKLSLQQHMHRAEHWVVVQGTARVTRGEEIITLHENESTFIPIGTVHRLENPGKIPLHLIEVQSGGYLGEDDIVRFDDTYGRT